MMMTMAMRRRRRREKEKIELDYLFNCDVSSSFFYFNEDKFVYKSILMKTKDILLSLTHIFQDCNRFIK